MDTDRPRVEIELSNATQYATAYFAGKPIATVQKRRVGAVGPTWQVFATDGTLLFKQTFDHRLTLFRRLREFAEGTGMFRDCPYSPANADMAIPARSEFPSTEA